MIDAAGLAPPHTVEIDEIGADEGEADDSEDEARAYIQDRVIGSYQQHGFGMWLTIQKLDDTPVGLAGLVRSEGLAIPDVGYAFAPQLQAGIVVQLADPALARRGVRGNQ